MATKENLQEIRSIVEDIKSGKRLHNQSEFHSDCGTAHCIAGWKVVDDMKTEGIVPEYSAFGELVSIANPLYEYIIEGIHMDDWEYAKIQWGLTTSEAMELFSPGLTINQISEALHDMEIDYDN